MRRPLTHPLERRIYAIGALLTVVGAIAYVFTTGHL